MADQRPSLRCRNVPSPRLLRAICRANSKRLAVRLAVSYTLTITLAIISRSRFVFKLVWARLGSNQRPADYESAALTS